MGSGQAAAARLTRCRRAVFETRFTRADSTRVRRFPVFSFPILREPLELWRRGRDRVRSPLVRSTFHAAREPDCVSLEPDTATTQSDAHLQWIERHADRVLAAGLLVSGNIILVSVLNVFVHLKLAGALLTAGLSIASFLLLHRALKRMMRGAVIAARSAAQVSRQMMLAVEQIGTESAGVRGTVEALAATAQGAGLEVFLWEAHERTLWSPAWGTQLSLTAAEARELRLAFAGRRPIRITDGAAAGSPLPADVAVRGGSSALIAAPMWSAEEFHGIVLRRYRSERELRRADDDALVASIAALGAVAIGKAIVVDREQQRARDNELLLRSVHAANESRQRDRLVDHVQQAAESVRAERAAIFALDSGRLRLVGAAGIERVVASGAGSIRLRSHLAELAHHAGTTSFSCELDALDDTSIVVLDRLGFAGGIVVQGLRDANGLVGMIVLDAPTGGIEEGAQAVLAAVGRQASMAIERTRMMRSIRKRSRHLACTPKLARSLTGQRDPEAVVRIAARELHEGFGFGRVSIALRDDVPGLGSGTSAGDEDLRIISSAGAPAAGGASLMGCTDALRECVETGRPYVSVAGDLEDVVASIAPEIPGDGPRDNDAPDGCRGRIVVPIAGRDRKVVGAIAVYEADPDLLGEDDLHMLETIADQLGGTIEQAALFSSLERSYFETVEALSSALEAKDAYTLDHARSITDMSADVGRRLGMREDEIRDLKLGALLHDIGKIGVPTEILSKPGPLTDDEFEVMKEHTVIGERIIADVEFLQGVRPLVLHEHERWDGAGYPHQLKGEEIPLGARIIFVCDSWHAMTSDRPYRQALPDAEALRRLRAGAGSQFDPSVVDAFCDLMEHEGSALPADAPHVVA
jgi:HD-GYP domain-containing protein (c-di-GMP phosphodiesterase class II)